MFSIPWDTDIFFNGGRFENHLVEVAGGPGKPDIKRRGGSKLSMRVFNAQS